MSDRMCVKRTERIKNNYFIKWRQFRGLSQDDVADAIERDRTTVSRLENGESNWTRLTIEGLCRAFDCSIAELFQDPAEINNVIAIWSRLPEERRPMALTMLRALAEGAPSLPAPFEKPPTKKEGRRKRDTA